MNPMPYHRQTVNGKNDNAAGYINISSNENEQKENGSFEQILNEFSWYRESDLDFTTRSVRADRDTSEMPTTELSQVESDGASTLDVDAERDGKIGNFSIGSNVYGPNKGFKLFYFCRLFI